jgi:hypothetical protein
MKNISVVLFAMILFVASSTQFARCQTMTGQGTPESRYQAAIKALHEKTLTDTMNFISERFNVIKDTYIGQQLTTSDINILLGQSSEKPGLTNLRDYMETHETATLLRKLGSLAQNNLKIMLASGETSPELQRLLHTEWDSIFAGAVLAPYSVLARGVLGQSGTEKQNAAVVAELHSIDAKERGMLENISVDCHWPSNVETYQLRLAEDVNGACRREMRQYGIEYLQITKDYPTGAREIDRQLYQLELLYIDLTRVSQLLRFYYQTKVHYDTDLQGEATVSAVQNNSMAYHNALRAISDHTAIINGAYSEIGNDLRISRR